MNVSDLTYEQILDKLRQLEQENKELKLYKQRYETIINELKNVYNTPESEVANQVVETNSRFQQIIDNIPGYVAYVNANTLVYEFVNLAFQKSFGIPREKIVGTHIREIIGEKNYEFALEYIETVKKGKAISYENVFNLQEGKRWIKVNYVPGFDLSGNVASIIVLSYDITEQKQAAESLKESEQFLNETGRIAKVGGWHLNIENHKLTWTSEVYNIHEVDVDYEPSPEKSLSFYKESSQEVIKRAMADAISIGRPFDVDVEMITQSGRTIQVKVIGNIQADQNGKPELIFGTFQDITRQKQIELKLSQLIADKDQFMSILAHDLKNPFNSLLGFSSLLLQNVRTYSMQRIEDQLRYIHQTAYKTYDLLEDLLIWIKNQSGELSMEPQQIILSDICNELIDNLQSQANTKGITINYFEPEKAIIYADLFMLKTILRNLISNSIKFTGNDGKIDIYTEKGETSLTIVISDNGIGITKEIQNRLWDSSKMYTTSGTAKEKGTGFGLLLCKNFVGMHGGKIWVESEPGKGSNFMFTMPLWNEL